MRSAVEQFSGAAMTRQRNTRRGQLGMIWHGFTVLSIASQALAANHLLSSMHDATPRAKVGTIAAVCRHNGEVKVPALIPDDGLKPRWRYIGEPLAIIIRRRHAYFGLSRLSSIRRR